MQQRAAQPCHPSGLQAFADVRSDASARPPRDTKVSRLVLDAGAFVAFERGDKRVRAHLAAARTLGLDLVTTAPVIAQVWRDGRKQALLAKLAAATRVVPPDESAARRAGELLARTRTNDVVDALVAVLTRNGDTRLTSDPADLRRLLDAAGIRGAIVSS